MNSSKKLEEIKSLIPLYWKKFKEDKNLENLLDHEEIRKDLIFWEIVNRGYENIKCQLPEPNKFIFSKIANKIQEQKHKKNSFFNLLSLNPRYSFVLLVAQFLLIISLIFYIFNLKYEYKTLSINNIKAESSASINVVFNENAKEIEIRDLLIRIDGKIINGPSTTGLYIISINNSEQRDLILKILRESKIVLFAEPAI